MTNFFCLPAEESFRAAIKGCQRVFLLPVLSDKFLEQTEMAVRILKEEGVGFVLKMSGMGSESEAITVS